MCQKEKRKERVPLLRNHKLEGAWGGGDDQESEHLDSSGLSSFTLRVALGNSGRFPKALVSHMQNGDNNIYSAYLPGSD